jgi:hypothetical protein
MLWQGVFIMDGGEIKKIKIGFMCKVNVCTNIEKECFKTKGDLTTVHYLDI